MAYDVYIERKLPTMKKLFTAALATAMVIAGAQYSIERFVDGSAKAYGTQVEAVAPVTECYSLKLNRETREMVKTTYAC